MDSTVFDFVWRDIVRRQYASAEAIDKTQYPDLSRHALKEVSEFAGLPAPDSGHELNLRRVYANSMMIDWKSELNRILGADSQ